MYSAIICGFMDHISPLCVLTWHQAQATWSELEVASRGQRSQQCERVDRGWQACREGKLSRSVRLSGRWGRNYDFVELDPAFFLFSASSTISLNS